ncbi:MAG: hypothetical protein ACJ72Z_14240 [Pyrinomonadaceae bacterium]
MELALRLFGDFERDEADVDTDVFGLDFALPEERAEVLDFALPFVAPFVEAACFVVREPVCFELAVCEDFAPVDADLDRDDAAEPDRLDAEAAPDLLFVPPLLLEAVRLGPDLLPAREDAAVLLVLDELPAEVLFDFAFFEAADLVEELDLVPPAFFPEVVDVFLVLDLFDFDAEDLELEDFFVVAIVLFSRVYFSFAENRRRTIFRCGNAKVHLSAVSL